MRTITVNTKRGQKSIETALETPAALAILAEMSGNSFAQDLARQAQTRHLSARQWDWVFYLAQEELNRRAAELATINAGMSAVVNDERQMDAVIAMFKHAGSRLKKPAVELTSQDGKSYRLSLNLEHYRNPGDVAVRCRGQYLGRITQDGLFLPSVNMADHPGLVDLLYRFAQDPAGVAAEHGKRTGCCCFCRLGLTDERSLAVGYGPVCAENFHLPWGAAKADSQDDVTARRREAARKAVETRRARLALALQSA